MALVLAVVLAAVPLGYAAAKAARGPVEMSFACAKKSNGKLRYVEAADDCRKKEQLVSFDDAEPLIACARMHGGGRVFVYAMAKRAECEYKKRRPSFVLVLPDTTRHWFCASNRSGNLRSTRLVPSAPGRARVFTRDCKRNELRVFVEKMDEAGPPETPNRAPSAIADAGSTNEDAATTIAVLGNDSDPDAGDVLSVTAVDTTGTAGAVTIGAGGALRYDPSGRLDGLRAGEQRLDRFAYSVSDGRGGTASANVSVTVTGVNDAPVVTTSAGSGGYTENGAAVAVDGGLTVADADDATLEGATVAISAGFQAADELAFSNTPAIAGTYNSGTGVLTLAGSASVADYQAALRSVEYDHTSDDPGASKTVQYRANDGDGLGPVATRTIDVAPVDDAPVAVDDSEITDEDADASAIDVLANDTDVDAGPKTISSASDPANGTVVLTGGSPGEHTGLTYQPDPSYCNNPPGTTPDAFTYTLNGGDTATVSVTVTCVDDAPTAVNDSATVGEDSGAGAIDVLANDTDIDGGPKTVDSITQPANGTVAITGGGTGLTYTPAGNYCNTQPGGAPDTFSYTLNGGDDAAVSVTVTCADDSPIAVNDSATVLEDASATSITVLTNDTDVDGGPKTIATATDPANGTVVLTGGSPGAHTGLTYQPDPNYCNDHAGGTADTFTYSLNGGSTATVSMTVTCAPDAPVVDNSAGSTSYTENAPATAIDSGVTVSDPDPGASTITGATVEITGGYAGAEDVLALAGSHPGISSSVSGDTLTLTGDASAAAYQAALRDVTYRNSSDAPSTAARTVTFTVTDGTTPASDTKGITVTAVDDPPTAVNDSALVLEDAAATAVPVLTNDTDIDGGPKTISSASDPANGTVVLTGGSPGAHTGLTYQPDPNYCNDPPGITPDTFSYTLNGGSSATVSLTVTCVNDAPVADDETFSGANAAVGNTALIVDDADDGAPSPSHPKKTISGDILAGDTDIDGPGPLTVTPGTFATNDGGSVTIESDGDFTYTNDPADGCLDTSDFFDYTVEDSGSPELTDTGRVTIAIAGCVWYVSNNAAGDSGTSAAPFNTLAQAETASGNNHTVFVFDGDDTSAGYGGDGYTMNSGERMLGEHEALQVGGDLLHPASPGALPTLTANNADVIDLDDGNEVRGFDIDPQGTGGGIAGSAGDTGGGTIDDVNIIDGGTAGTQPGLELNATTGTFTVTNFVVSNSATGILLNNAGTTDFGTTMITSAGAPGLSATGTNMSTSTFDTITSSSSTNGGVNLDATTGTTVLGDGVGTDLNLTTTSGSQPAFRLSDNTGTVTVGAGGTDNVSATGGPAVDVTGTSGATLAFDDVDSTNSTGDGVNIAGLGAGTFTANGASSLSNAAGIDFDLDGGSGAITYEGTISDDVGQLLRVANTSGGTKDFNGSITDGGDGDGSGVSLTGNTGATIRLDGGLTLATGANPAFTATGGGTIAVTDPNAAGTAPDNTIDTTTGTALNITNTSIGGDDVTFRRISANGASNGIRLNNTANALGRLVVTGNGGTCTSAATCTGGAIQNSTGAGVELTSVPGGASLTLSAVTGGQDDGIRATTVGTTGGSGLDLANSFVSSNGNAVGERGLDYDNVIGSSSITNSTIRVSSEDNARWENDNGTLGLTVTGSTFADNSAVSGADGLLLLGDVTATMTANVTGNTFTHNRDDGFQLATKSPVSGSHAPQMNVTFTGNDVVQGVNNAPNNAAMHISHGSAADVKFKMEDNDLSGSLGSALILNPGPDSTSQASFDAIVTNNRIGTGVADSGSVSGIGIWGRAAGNGVNRFEIRNNTVRNFQQQGMYLRGNEGTGQVTDYTVTGNTITNPDGTGFRILLEAGSSAGDSTDVCADYGGAAALRNTVASAGIPADIGVARDFAGSTLTLRDYSGGDLSTYFNSRNIGAPTPLTAILSNLAPAGSAAPCALPVTPPLP